MSRIAKSPINVPAGVDVKFNGKEIVVKGKKGVLTLVVNNLVDVKLTDSVLTFAPLTADQAANALAGTTRALLNNMVKGVSEGFEKKLVLNGVGYRAKAAGNVLSLTLGYSHPIEYTLPEGVTVETPSQTEILLKCVDKHLLGQVAAKVRGFRAPEPYKGKGVRYSTEIILRKDAKKK